MTGRDAAETLILMAEKRIELIKRDEHDLGHRMGWTRRELGAIRVALLFLNMPGVIIPEVPPFAGGAK